MKVICAYCKKFIGYKKDPLGRKTKKETISHGACEKCYQEELRKLKEHEKGEKR